jgi:hypothetical protein
MDRIKLSAREIKNKGEKSMIKKEGFAGSQRLYNQLDKAKV